MENPAIGNDHTRFPEYHGSGNHHALLWPPLSMWGNFSSNLQLGKLDFQHHFCSIAGQALLLILHTANEQRFFEDALDSHEGARPKGSCCT